MADLYYTTDTLESMKRDDKNGDQMLANFQAWIAQTVTYTDGKNDRTEFVMHGKSKNREFPVIRIPADKFAALSWVLSDWGPDAIIYPGQGCKEDLRTSIQAASEPERKTVYEHTGWTKIAGKPHYLHATGAIGAGGDKPATTVRLPHELRHFSIKPGDAKSGVLATLSLTELGPPEIMWPLVASTIAPIACTCDFAVHLAGRTGTYKSETASLLQSHYGEGMDARNLPGSWSSTANALEAQAYRAKNALFVVDDFIPIGSSWQQRAYQKTADQIIRGQGNQAGRARLTDMSSLQTTMYPRGLVLSTGEDIPEGHSVRARMMILELTPDDIKRSHLTASQNARQLYQAGLHEWIKDIASGATKGIETIKNKFRDDNIEVGHSRTPTTIGTLLAVIQMYLEWAKSKKYIKPATAKSLESEALQAIIAAGATQHQFLIAADPCEAFCDAIRTMLAGHTGHLRTLTGGIPRQPELLGWTSVEAAGDLPTYKAHGKKIGWVNWPTDELLIDVTGAWSDIRKHAAGGMQLTKQTMLKRLKDAGMLLRQDDTRQRNTVRVTAEGHPRAVLALSLSQTLNLGELTDE